MKVKNGLDWYIMCMLWLNAREIPSDLGLASEAGSEVNEMWFIR